MKIIKFKNNDEIQSCMTVGELKKELNKFDDNMILFIYFDGRLAPVHNTQLVSENNINFVEIGCGLVDVDLYNIKEIY